MISTAHPKPIQKMQRDNKFADARAVMKRIGGQLVQERKLAFSEGDSGNSPQSGKDLLSLLVKANMNDSEGSSMSDEDVQDRESTPLYPNFLRAITSPTLYLPPSRNRYLYRRWPRNEQCRNLLVPSLFIQQPRSAEASTRRDSPTRYRLTGYGADKVSQIPGSRRERGAKVVPSHSVNFESCDEGRYHPALRRHKDPVRPHCDPG